MCIRDIKSWCACMLLVRVKCYQNGTYLVWPPKQTKWRYKYLIKSCAIQIFNAIRLTFMFYLTIQIKYFFHLHRIRQVKLSSFAWTTATLPYSVYLHGCNNLYPQLYTMLLVYTINSSGVARQFCTRGELWNWCPSMVHFSHFPNTAIELLEF